jgi:hypothetical protein
MDVLMCCFVRRAAGRLMSAIFNLVGAVDDKFSIFYVRALL